MVPWRRGSPNNEIIGQSRMTTSSSSRTSTVIMNSQNNSTGGGNGISSYHHHHHHLTYRVIATMSVVTKVYHQYLSLKVDQ